MGRSRSSAGLSGMRHTRKPAFLLGLSVALMLGAGPAQAEKVGVAAAVNPDAFSSLSGTPNQQLNIGKSIFYNERINTTNSGLVQVLLVDGSTFTVGPNSNLVIDRFVYDPRRHKQDFGRPNEFELPVRCQYDYQHAKHRAQFFPERW